METDSSSAPWRIRNLHRQMSFLTRYVHSVARKKEPILVFPVLVKPAPDHMIRGSAE